MEPWEFMFYLCGNGRIRALAVGREPERNNYPSDSEVLALTGYTPAELGCRPGFRGRYVGNVRYHSLRADSPKNGAK